jgi:hypothetical protein
MVRRQKIGMCVRDANFPIKAAYIWLCGLCCCGQAVATADTTSDMSAAPSASHVPPAGLTLSVRLPEAQRPLEGFVKPPVGRLADRIQVYSPTARSLLVFQFQGQSGCHHIVRNQW